jgi:hypothetical protein
VWVLRRSTDLVPALVGLAVRDWLTGEEIPEITVGGGTSEGPARDMVPVSEVSST